MTLFFNLETLEKEASCDILKFMHLLYYHYSGSIPKSRTKTKYKPSTVPLHGYSFILNPKPLFLNNLIDTAYLVQYVKLAGRRDYTLYKTHGLKSLDLSYFPDIKREKIAHNPLLDIKNNHIHFKYEDIWH